MCKASQTKARPPCSLCMTLVTILSFLSARSRHGSGARRYFCDRRSYSASAKCGCPMAARRMESHWRMFAFRANPCAKSKKRGQDAGHRHRSGVAKPWLGRDRRRGLAADPCRERHLPFRRRRWGPRDAPAVASRATDRGSAHPCARCGGGGAYLRQQGRGGDAETGPGAGDRAAGAGAVRAGGRGICAERGEEDRGRRGPCGQGAGRPHGQAAIAGRR